ncbi:LysR family transcriptional regulator [Jonesia quinghaiensis]|uniref:LysR family transcriptional regulator n=1 Tax=Jonesia quinghaiensis TaxID=262806 RepID=UPI0004051C46|nr:LysR family transcriptional regulator [Jonesia quinghaiensis]
MLDVRRLRVLLELQRRGTLADVATALHQTPSAISQQLTHLEREAGTPLLRKVGRRVQLTPAAHTLATYAAHIIDLLDQAHADVTQADAALTGTVNVAAFQSAVLAFMPEALRILATQHPNLRVTMSQREPETALRGAWTRDFDLVIAEQYPGHAAPWHPELDRMELTTDAIRLAVPEVFAQEGHRPVTSLADANDVPWVMEPRGAASRHWAEQACRQAGFEPDVRFETADLQAHLALIASGNAVALLPGLMTLNPPAGVQLIDLPGRPRRTVFTAVRTAITGRGSIIELRRTLAQVTQDLTA